MPESLFHHDLLIGVDDTDNHESIGTGRLCRMLAAELRAAGYAVRGVTRHQHLRDPAIPFTSNNSSCALGLDGSDLAPEAVERLCAEFLAAHFHEGADPGLCVARVADVEPCRAQAATFGRATQERVVAIEEAWRGAAEFGVRLSAHGGTGLGVIGALAAVCLRATGNDGRFLELGDLRGISGELSAGEIVSAIPIEGVYSADGSRLPADARVRTNDWVRPALSMFYARLIVEPDSHGAWKTVRPQHVD
ncbi:MAG: ABC transporter substrate-binding protein [Planctomycetaceae bacterium]